MPSTEPDGGGDKEAQFCSQSLLLNMQTPRATLGILILCLSEELAPEGDSNKGISGPL